MGGANDPRADDKIFEELIQRRAGAEEFLHCDKDPKVIFGQPSKLNGHGTTVIILYNAWGVFIISDGRVFTSYFDKEKDTKGHVSDLNCKKTHILGGGRLLVTGAGALPWVYSVIDHLKLVAHETEWTSLQCAKSAKFHMNNGFGHHPKHSDLTATDMKSLDAHMVFATFGNEPSVYYADKNIVKEIVIDSRYGVGSEEWVRDFGFVGYTCLGTGRFYVDQVFSKATPDHGKSLQESMLTLLKLMHVAVRWNKDTAGTMELHHMNLDGVVKVVPPFDETEIEAFIDELGGQPYDYEFVPVTVNDVAD